jgi:hypothetical protein
MLAFTWRTLLFRSSWLLTTGSRSAKSMTTRRAGSTLCSTALRPERFQCWLYNHKRKEQQTQLQENSCHDKIYNNIKPITVLHLFVLWNVFFISSMFLDRDVMSFPTINRMKTFFVQQVASLFLWKICTSTFFVCVTYAWLDAIYAGLCLYLFLRSTRQSLVNYK